MKRLREIAAIFGPLGWTWSITNGGHVRWTHASGAIVFAAYSPSDHRAVRNLKSQLRRMTKGQ